MTSLVAPVRMTALRPPRVPLPELCACVEKAIREMGRARKDAQMRKWSGDWAIVKDWIRLFDSMLVGTKEERFAAVRNQTRAKVRDLCYDIDLRGGDVTFGWIVKGAMDARDIDNGRRGDYGVEIEWAGPKPATWPEPVTRGPVITDAQAEEAGREIEKKDPERFNAAKSVLVGTDAAVKKALHAQAEAQKVARRNLRILRGGGLPA